MINGQNENSRIQSLVTNDYFFKVDAYALDTVKLMMSEIAFVIADFASKITIIWDKVTGVDS